jgi:hypothetical protein
MAAIPASQSLQADPRAWFRSRIDAGLTEADLDPVQPEGLPTRAVNRLGLTFPPGLEPVAVPLTPRPATSDALPTADVLVLVWTVAEARALADVLTPGVAASSGWYRYDRRFAEYLDDIRNGAPSRTAGRLGSYHLGDVGGRSVLCFKSELHLNQDGVRRNGHTSLPVAQLIDQLIDEVQPRLVVTSGTCGGTMRSHGLGDVVITRAAAFRLASEFAGESFAQATYRSRYRVPRQHIAQAEAMMRTLSSHLDEPAFGAPSDAYTVPGLGDGVLPGPTHVPRIHIDGSGDVPRNHPILSADWFLFGSTTNGLDAQGVGVEMGDAVIGLVDERRAADGRARPLWVVVRNLSNPPINGHLPTEPLDMQAFWSGWYYESFGYWTSVNSALGVWAIVAPAPP